MKRKIFVISGAAGMTGLELVKQLNETFSESIQIIFDNGFNSDLEYSRNKIIELNNYRIKEYFKEFCDVSNKAFLESLEELIQFQINLLESENIESEVIFINCAAVVHTKHFYHPSETFNVNVLGMKYFLDLAISLNASTFINCSTSEVYSWGSYRNGGVKENDILQLHTAEHSLRTSYAMGKLLTEHFLKEAVDENKIKGCSIRFANVYSDDELEAEHIIPLLIKKGIKNEEINLTQNAKFTYRTFLHNEDSANSIVKLIENIENLDGTSYNVGTIKEYTIPELVDIVENELIIQLNTKLKINYNNENRKSDPVRRLLNCDKISHIGWYPKISLEEGIKRCVTFNINMI